MHLIKTSRIFWWLFIILWFITFTDYSQDYALHLGASGGAVGFSPFYFFSSVIVGFLFIAGIIMLLYGKSGYRPQKEIKLFLILFILSSLWGVYVGAVKGVPLKFLIGDSRNTVCYFMLFALAGALKYLDVSSMRRILLITGLIFFVKILFAVINLALIYKGGFSWRYYLKLSNFFPLFLFVALSQYVISKLRRDKLKYAVFALMAACGIFAAQARGIFVGTLAGGIVLSISLFGQIKLRRLVMPAVFILCVGLGAGYFMQDDITKSFGYWGEHNETYSFGMSYRLRQANRLLENFQDNWASGAGLGSYDSTSESYEEWLPRPYLAELEYNNLLAKLGIVGFSLWISAFMMLIIGSIKSARKSVILNHRMFVYSLIAGLISLMVQSIIQTGYSSLSFHLYVVFMLLSISLVNKSNFMLKVNNLNTVNIQKEEKDDESVS